MKAGFYPKLAWTGIRKNKKMYLPYILTCVGMVMMYYIITFLSSMELLMHMSGGDSIRVTLSLGSFVIAVFAVIFLFYTNSFLMRRRRKEFGLYNILGMGKGNIGRVLLWESLITAVITLLVGLFAGVALSKFAELALVNIVGGTVSFTFSVSIKAIMQTLILFGVIFVLILLNALRQIRAANAIALLHSENTGEKPPKANWFLGVLGIILLATAYYIAVSIKDPISALSWFFIAVLMVIAATYLLFIAGSVLLCRVLQKKKSYYYTPRHFVSVSSMVYRMKRNGAGLASICILATMVLVMITGSACLSFGKEDSLRSRHPRDIAMDISLDTPQDGETITLLRSSVQQIQKDSHAQVTNILDYRLATIVGNLSDGVFKADNGIFTSSISNSYDNIAQIYFIPLEDYNRLMGTNETLAADEAMIYSVKSKYKSDTLTIEDSATFRIVKDLDSFADESNSVFDLITSLYVVVPDYESQMEQLMQIKDSSSYRLLRMHWQYSFDSSASEADQIKLKEQIHAICTEQSAGEESEIVSFRVKSLAANRKEFYGLYGGVFFLGIMLSIVFIFATVLIIYYKQISEGYEDQSRYEIMQKVGMTKPDIRRSINSQILTVFFLPLVTSIIHLAFAFPMIHKLLMLFDLRNFPLLLITAGISSMVFAVLYMFVYRLTSNAYYSIVSGAKES